MNADHYGMFGPEKGFWEKLTYKNRNKYKINKEYKMSILYNISEVSMVSKWNWCVYHNEI